MTSPSTLAMAPAQSFDDLASGILARAVVAGLVGPGTVADLRGPGVAVHTGTVLTAGEGLVAGADVGFTPTVWFAVNGDGAEARWLTVTALTLDVGDAALVDGAGTVWLVRRDGELFVSDDDDLWPAAALDQVPGRYTRRSLGPRAV